jgi:DNA polymerase III subunit gamma/tau
VSPARKKQIQDEASAPAPAPLPLNRKYRPQSFDSDELVGQEHIVRTLKNAIRSNRIAPAYLFCGPRGTGKTSTARILAKAANCLDPDADKRPCNQCIACIAINSGATTDVIEIDAASNRGIDDIRDLRDRVNYAPTQLKTKFYIIDEAHQITGAAANAFLKTLEEPPAHTRFILATTDPEELLPTIVSRCQRFDFRRHTPEIIAKRIRALADREGIRLADDALALIADLAHGSMRDPIGLLDQLSNYQAASGTELSADDVRSLVGISHSEVAVRIYVAIGEGNAQAALQAINEAVIAGQDPRQLNRQILSLIRDGLYIASGARTKTEEPHITEATERLGLQRLLHIATSFADTDYSIRLAVIPQLPLEMAVLDSIIGPAQPAQDAAHQTAMPAQPVPRPQPRQDEPTAPRQSPREPEPAEIPNAIEPTSPGLAAMVRDRDRTPGQSAGKTTPATSKAASADVVANDNGLAQAVGDGFTIEMLVDIWPRVRADVKSLDRRTEALLMEIEPIDITADEIVLAAAYEFHRDKLNEEDRRALVESVIGRRVGRTIRVSCVLRSEYTPAGTRREQTAAPIEPAPTEVVAQAEAEPEAESPDEMMLGAVVRIFDGEIVED